MNILFVSALLPYPLHSGGQVRLYNLLKRLGTRHSITLYAFVRRREEIAYLKHLSFLKKVELVWRGHAWQPRYVLRALFSAYPFLMCTYDSDQMRRKIAQELTTNAYDLVHLEPFYVWPSLPATSLPLVVGEHNVEYEVYTGYVKNFSLVWLRPFLYLDVLKMRFWERRIWAQVNYVTGVSEYDTKAISRAQQTGHVYLVPNGVDPREFPFRPQKTVPKKPTFLFVGTFKWIQNRQAIRYILEHIWPLLLRRYPTASLRIIGPSLPRSLGRSFDQHVSYVPEVASIASEYSKADVLLAPIWVGGGTRYKILEAMASGLPVVTTPEGAKGLLANDGQELVIASSPESLVGACVSVLEDSAYRKRLVKAARAVIEKNYSWDTIAKALEVVWQEAYEARR